MLLFQGSISAHVKVGGNCEAGSSPTFLWAPGTKVKSLGFYHTASFHSVPNLHFVAFSYDSLISPKFKHPLTGRIREPAGD